MISMTSTAPAWIICRRHEDSPLQQQRADAQRALFGAQKQRDDPAGRVKRGPIRPKQDMPPELREPLATLGLSWPTTLDAVKTRYKELAKRHHPDANGGDRAAEERLKIINLAYAALRSRLVPVPSVAAAG